MNQSSIIQIGDCLVSSEIVTEYFACDYAKCKGCCCVIGDSGAPITEKEIVQIERNFANFYPLMSQAGREAVQEKGFFEIDMDGDIVTPLVTGSEECAYSNFDPDGGCFCTMERKWCAGECGFRKPVSCHLYPIRVSKLSSGLTALNLHKWAICKDGYAKGRREGIRVYEFLQEPIVRQFGTEFLQALKECAKRLY